MDADIKGALEQINFSYKCFVHNDKSLSKSQVKSILGYGITKGYKYTSEISSEEIDLVLNNPEKIPNRKINLGDIVRANCSAIGRYIGNGKCLYVSAMDSYLCVDKIDEDSDWTNIYNLPLPEDADVFKYSQSLNNQP